MAFAGIAVARTSFFFADDFLFGAFFVERPVTLDLLLRSYFGHLVPANALFASLFYKSVGLNWTVSAILMVALLVLGSVAVTRLLDAWRGRRRVFVLAGAAFGLSIGVLTMVAWWGASLGNLVPLVAGISFLGSMTRWDANRRLRHLVAAMLMFTLAVLFFEKALFFAVYAMLWSVIVLDSGKPMAERVRRSFGRWQLWIPVGVVSAAVTFVYVTGEYRSESGATAPLTVLATFIVRGIVLGLVPSVFGLDLQEPVWAAARLPLAIAANVVVLGFIAWSIGRSRRNVGVWVFVALAILLGEIPLAVGRAGLYGTDGGRLLRYQIEGSLFLVIGAAAAVTNAQRAVSGAGPRARKRISAGTGAVAGVSVLLVGVALATSVTAFVRANPGTASRHWVDGFTASWPQDRTVVMVDGPLPANFMFDWTYPYSMASKSLPQLVDNVEFTTSVEGAWAMGPDGSVGPFAFDASQEWQVVQCADAGQPVTVPIDDASTGPRQLLIEYRADGVGDVQIVAGVGEALGDTSGLSPVFTTSAGRGAFVMTVRPGTTIDTVRVSSEVPGFCVDSVSVGVTTSLG